MSDRDRIDQLVQRTLTDAQRGNDNSYRSQRADNERAAIEYVVSRQGDIEWLRRWLACDPEARRQLNAWRQARKAQDEAGDRP